MPEFTLDNPKIIFYPKYTKQSEKYLNLDILFKKKIVIHRSISEDKSYKVEPVYAHGSGICILYFVVKSLRLLANKHINEEQKKDLC